MVTAPPFQRRETSAGAVLISCASQDVHAARRIGEALRSVGTPVWMDPNAARGSGGEGAETGKGSTTVRADPGFQALLNDPKNDEPL